MTFKFITPAKTLCSTPDSHIQLSIGHLMWIPSGHLKLNTSKIEFPLLHPELALSTVVTSVGGNSILAVT